MLQSPSGLGCICPCAVQRLRSVPGGTPCLRKLSSTRTLWMGPRMPSEKRKTARFLPEPRFRFQSSTCLCSPIFGSQVPTCFDFHFAVSRKTGTWTGDVLAYVAACLCRPQMCRRVRLLDTGNLSREPAHTQAQDVPKNAVSMYRQAVTCKHNTERAESPRACQHNGAVALCSHPSLPRSETWAQAL